MFKAPEELIMRGGPAESSLWSVQIRGASISVPRRFLMVAPNRKGTDVKQRPILRALFIVNRYSMVT